ncbi:TonB-dependent hemoglobin/transferrin/lactoferrin family receptor [Gemmobacter serpentinus]|uniref:TonB-dependent hemoglobin/transferrin/lactoferrin family receptor n=1 Tax=Gemmobacter serpentinus TaxID=2652247 RepID=UPI00186586D6|nr:TonB-dependent hemoglobin/transferrin/lactoferrin family receptor [Gemmobacter serpentinus]
MRFHPLPTLSRLLVGVAVLAPATASAQEVQLESDEGAVLLQTVVLTATRIATGVYETLSGSSAISGADLELRYPGGKLTDVMAGIPGVTTQTSADDPGVAVNVRGMQDFGRVAVMVDGARQNFQKNGHEANGTFYMDMQMLKSVDVTRGPVSSVYGSGAIGGVVSMTTLDADDLIAEGETSGVRLRFGLDSNGPGPSVNIVGATRLGERSDVVLGGTFQELRDYTSGGDQKVDSAQAMRSGLFKYRFRPTEGQELTFSASRYVNDFENGVRATDTTVTADTLTAGYRLTSMDSDLIDLSFKVYSTGTKFEQFQPGGASEQSFDVGTTGLDLFNTARFSTGAVDHELTIGADMFRDRVKTNDNLGNSDELTPSGKRLAWGAYVQDRLQYDGWLEVIGGLRYDGYKLEDDTTKVSGNRLSPKLTLGLHPNENVTFFASYAEGYRAPSLTETLIDGLHPPPVMGRFVPNPDLRPEIAQTVEMGVNLRFNDVLREEDQLNLKLTAFRNNVDDYIDQVFMMFPLPGGYQYQNFSHARLHGFELEAAYDNGAVFASLAGQVLKGRKWQIDPAGFSQSSEPLKDPPYRVTATAGIRLLDERLTLGARANLVGAKSNAAATGFSGERYETLDLFAQYAFSDSISANLALNNVFDRDYTQYLNADPSPGFNARAQLTLKF